MTQILSQSLTIKPAQQPQHRIRWISRRCSVPISTAAAIDALAFGEVHHG